MARRAVLTAVYIVAFAVLLEFWPAVARSPHREAFVNDVIEFAGGMAGIPLLLGALLGARRRGDRLPDYAPFAVAPAVALAIRAALLGAPFTWLSIPLWAVGSLFSVAGAWGQATLSARARRRGAPQP